MPDRKTVMISSTARDLPEHRKEVMDACMRLDMFHPEMMEHLTATDANAKQVSLKMVEKADIYLGIFGFRYGHVPEEDNPGEISVTEMEYNRAVERNIPRLIFLMGDDHPVLPKDVETGDGAEKLRKLKDRLKTERVVGSFKSADDLRAQVIQALVPYREPDLTTFHYISDIPAAPEAYIAHPYTLLQTHRLVGRQAELNLLTDWVTGKALGVSDTPRVSIFNIVAIGGMGKSALTWKWFNDIAPQEMRPLAGRMWWSFYESDATFENFVIRALAYVTGRAREDVEKNTKPGEREEQLLAALDRAPFLLVLDGLERILIAYARLDAARLADDDFDRQTANVVAGAHGLPASAAHSFVGQHRLRKTADPRAGAFLRKLAGVRASRVLVSTRLYPADLQAMTGAPCPGCTALFLPGLSEDDALELWRAFGVSGGRETLLPLFARFERHPLLIQVLASQVAGYRPAPGDFEQWRRDHPGFSPADLPLVQVRSHVLAYALTGLDGKALQVLRTIAAFRMPARYDTLAALLANGPLPSPTPVATEDGGGGGKRFSDERELDAALTELEDRGLVGWDKRANRYDLHPIVRGVVWSGMPDDTRTGVFTSLQTHFGSVPQIDEDKVNSLEDLTPAIELYNTLIGLGQYDDAYAVFRDRLEYATLHLLSASRQHAELLEMLFSGDSHFPLLSEVEDQGTVLNSLALSYVLSGRPGHAVSLFEDSSFLFEQLSDWTGTSTTLGNLADALRLSGMLHKSEWIARKALVIDHSNADQYGEATNLRWLGLALATRGLLDSAKISLSRGLAISGMGIDKTALAQWALWSDREAEARLLSREAWELALRSRHERDLIRAALLEGMSSLRSENLDNADDRLHYALSRARAANHAERELQSLVALAELRRRQRDLQAARDLLDDVWEPAERGPYPLIHADACNVLAQIELDAGNRAAAIEAATAAYRLAWCDGEPYAYHWGLVAARRHLVELGAPEPAMPPFDESKYEPMPEVEINPDDEFHVDESSDGDP